MRRILRTCDWAQIIPPLYFLYLFVWWPSVTTASERQTQAHALHLIDVYQAIRNLQPGLKAVRHKAAVDIGALTV